MTTEIHPAALSADSKRNAYCNHCKIIGQAKPYPMCIRLIEDAKAGIDHPPGYQDCSKAIAQFNCPAIDMRQEEILMGKAIYFIDKGVDRVLGGVGRWIMGFVKSAKTEAPAAPAPSKKSFEQTALSRSRNNDFASAVNIAAKKPETPVTTVPKAMLAPGAGSMKRGESPLAAARRLMGQKTSSTIES